VQGDASHHGSQGGGPKKNNQEKMEFRGGEEAQGVADPKKPCQFMPKHFY
jgi:hypothetical protein